MTDLQTLVVQSVLQMRQMKIKRLKRKNSFQQSEGIVKELETPTLAEFGIDKDEFFKVIDKMAYDAMDSGSPQNTMREVSEEQVKQIYRNLW